MARRRRQRRLGGLLSGKSKWPVILAVAGVLMFAGGSVAHAAVYNRPRNVYVINRWAADGVHPGLQAFLDYWEEHGPFDIEIGSIPGYPGGGLRTGADANGQLAACQSGLSDACDLASTPHGRGAALDLWPVGVGFKPSLTWEQWTPEIRSAFATIGAIAKQFGLVWGGDWRSAKFPHGDQPHVELKNWRQLPFPPPNYVA